MQIRRRLRLAIRDVLADVSFGFNETLAQLAPDYGIDPFEIDFDEDSNNLFFGFLPPETNISSICEYPAFVIYTTDAQNTHEVKTVDFSGTVTAHVDVWIRFHDGPETRDTESICEAIEDAIVKCFERDAAPWPVGVNFTGNFQSFWQPIGQLEDGWERVLPLEFLFQITA